MYTQLTLRIQQLWQKSAAESNPLTVILKHGYFFDDFYEKGIARGVMILSGGLHMFENSALGKLPLMVAGFTISSAIIIHKYFDTLTDQLISVIAYRTLRGASKINKLPISALQNYIAAALIGFILIVIVIVLTIGV